MALGWRQDINQNCYNISPGNVDIQKKKKKKKKKKTISTHTTLCSEASRGNTFKSWRISMKKKNTKKKAAALLLYIKLEHDKNSCRSNIISYFLVCSLLCLESSAPFFSNRLTHCRIRQTSVLTRTILCQFHAKDGFKVLANCHHEA